jgi:sugar phosphate isomerase/epimerase
MQWTLGATTRPWHTWTFAEACQAIAEAGYREVAVFSNAGKIPVTAESAPEEIEATAATARAHGLVPSLLLGGPKLDMAWDAAIADHCRLIDAAAALGARWLLNGGTENPAQYEAYQTIMRETAPYAAEKGVTIVLKPHGGIGLTGRDLARVVERVGSPAFRICYDPGNILYYTQGKVRPETDVSDVAEHVAVGIIKDCIVREGQPDVWILPGEGWVDFPRVLGLLHRAGFAGPLYVECLGGSEWDDIKARARRTREWIEGIVEALEP